MIVVVVVDVGVILLFLSGNSRQSCSKNQNIVMVVPILIEKR